MRQLALFGIEFLMVPLVIGLAGAALLAYRGTLDLEERGLGLAANLLSLLLLGWFFRGVKAGETMAMFISILVCGAYLVHFGTILATERTLPNGIVWLSAVASLAATVGLLGCLIVKR